MFGFGKAYQDRVEAITAADSVKLIDGMLTHLDGGRNWKQGAYGFFDQQKCLVSALHYARCQKIAAVDHAERWIKKAIREMSPDMRRIPSFAVMEIYNDNAPYSSVAAVLVRAKEMATAAIPMPKMNPPLEVTYEHTRAPVVPFFERKWTKVTNEPITIEGNWYGEVTTPCHEPEVARVLASAG